MEDCAVCGEAVSGEYKCWHGHEYHRTCLKSSTKKKTCLLCDFTVMLPRVARGSRGVGPKKERSARCKGMTAGGKKCRKRTLTGYCHLHQPSMATEVEHTADTIEL
jgi:hypothetical protein